MNCPVCNEGTAKLVERKNYTAQYNGEPVQVPAVEVYHCADCGEDFLNPEQSHALAVAVKNEVRKKLGLLPPERITAIREKAGLTQAELEELLCQGPKVVVRWESGKVIQSGSADTVLRLLERAPELVRALKEIEKQRFAQQRKYTPARGGVSADPRGPSGNRVFGDFSGRKSFVSDTGVSRRALSGWASRAR